MAGRVGLGADTARPDIAADVGAIVRHWSALAPEREALRGEGGARTWGELADRVGRLGRALAADGVGPGGRVACLDRNDPALVEATLAAAEWGFCNTVVNWRLAADEVRYVLADAGAEVLFVGAEFLPVVERIRDKLPALRRVVVIGEEYESYLAGAPEEPLPGHEAGPDDCFLQLYTSGTTGFPKGAMLTHRSVAAHTLSAAGVFGFDFDSVATIVLPLFHVGGMSWALQSLYVGGRTITVRELVPAAVLELIGTQRVTHAFFVPTVYEFFLAVPDLDRYDLSSLRCLGYGGSPMPLPLMRRCLAAFDADFYQVYGCTEASGVFCVLGPADHRDPAHPERLTSAGRPIPGAGLRVVDPETGQDVPAGGTGEFWIRGEQVMLGYWRRPEDTAAVFRDGWYRTGDAGHVDADGYVFVRDRVKDMIVSGGENIYPVEVERVLLEHPGVADACVIGVPDPVYGEAVKAVIVTGGAGVEPAELIEFTRSRLARYKCPKSVDVVDGLPRNATGKVLKRELRAAYWAGRERAI